MGKGLGVVLPRIIECYAVRNGIKCKLSLFAITLTCHKLMLKKESGP
jgi:hypothetical protein